MSDVKLGQYPQGAVGRDAIHMAIVPLMSSSYLKPGEHVGWDHDSPKTVSSYTEKPFGIVDPFLSNRVEPGVRVWVCLYPGTIASLRHVWSHPDFNDEPALTTQKEAEIRLQELASTLGYDYERFLAALESGEDCYAGEECYHIYDHTEQILSDFYAVTGRRLSGLPQFRCSC
jgi:hypothetical protein